MKFRRTATSLALAALAGALATPCAGQWPNYATPGIPRLPDGKANLAAPTPRTAEGKPDLSGMWQVERSGHVQGFAWNVAQDLKPDEVESWARSVYRERVMNLGKDAPMAHCLPPGLAPLNSFPTVFTRIAQTPALIVIMYRGETNDFFRIIFTDGRKLPADPNPTWLGYSIGRWEGDTLVVNTAGFNDRGWLDLNGHPQTASLHITESFRRRNFGHMEYEITIEDPKVFTRPLSMRMEKVLAPDTELLETICENEKDAGHMVGSNGFRLKSEDLSKYIGTYEFTPGRQATVTLVDDLLVLQEGANGLRRPLVPQSETDFDLRDNGDPIEFVKDAQGAVIAFITHGGDGDQKAVRKTDTFQKR